MPGVTLSNEIYEIVERSPVHLFQNDRTLSTLQANSRIPVFTRDSDTTTPWEEGEGWWKAFEPRSVVSLRLFAQLIAFADSRRKLTDQLKM